MPDDTFDDAAAAALAAGRATDTFEANELVLQDRHFRIRGTVRQQLAPQVAPKILTGGTDRESEVFLSSNVMETWRGGLLVERQLGNQPTDRLWESTLDSRWERELRLPPKINVLTAANGVPANSTVLASGQIAYDLTNYLGVPPENLAVFGFANGLTGFTNWYTWNDSANVLVGPSVANTATPVQRHGVNLFEAGSYWLVFAVRDGIVYYKRTSTTLVANYQKPPTANTVIASHLVVWDAKLFALDNATGNFYFAQSGVQAASSASSPWQQRGALPLRPFEVQDLVVMTNAYNTPVIHALTKSGVWAYDFVADAWQERQLKWPRTFTSGRGCFWRGNLMIPVGQSLFEYTGQTTRNLGVDRDYGLPPIARGDLAMAEDAFSWLAVGTDSAEATLPSHYPHIFLWDGAGWHFLYRGGGASVRVNYLAYHQADNPRLFFSMGDTGLAYVDLPKQVYNPRFVTTTQYANTGYAIFPWLDMGWAERDKTGSEVHVRTLQCSSTSTVTVWYAVDESPNWNLLGRIASDGLTVFQLGTAATNDGVAFRNIRFQVQLDNTSTDITKTPILQFLAVRYLVQGPPRYSYTFTVDCSDVSPDGYDPYEQITFVQGLVSKFLFNTVEFRRNGRSLGNLADRRVEITQFAPTNHVGSDERSLFSMTVIEV